MYELCFLQNSRLHFIGTWRNRYRKRFPNQSNGLKHVNPNPNSSAEKMTIIHVDMVFFKFGAVKIEPEFYCLFIFSLLLVNINKDFLLLGILFGFEAIWRFCTFRDDDCFGYLSSTITLI